MIPLYGQPAPDPVHDRTLPMVKKQLDTMTLAEARLVGLAAQRYQQLGDALTQAKSGSIGYSTSNGSASIALTLIDLQAALALLIEREVQYLASYGVTLEGHTL